MEDALVRTTTLVFHLVLTVLILVLMEDALVRGGQREGRNKINFVLILVLMEDALVPFDRNGETRTIKGLNPCFNGRCTSTVYKVCTEEQTKQSLNPCFNGRCTST